MMETTTTPTDRDLVQAYIRRRDEKAFRELVMRHAAMVMSVCQHVLRDRNHAEDGARGPNARRGRRVFCERSRRDDRAISAGIVGARTFAQGVGLYGRRHKGGVQSKGV